jgi:hypothetical protein
MIFKTYFVLHHKNGGTYMIEMKYVYLCTTNMLQMKNLILSFTVLLAGCVLLASCGGSEDTPDIQQGEWEMYEQKVETTDAYLDNMLNNIFYRELKENETTRTFSELSVRTTVRKRETSGTEGLISEVSEAYTIKGDSIYIENQIYEGIMVSRYLITDNTLTTYREISSEDIKKIVPNMGIDPNSIPGGVTGLLKIKEKR